MVEKGNYLTLKLCHNRLQTFTCQNYTRCVLRVRHHHPGSEKTCKNLYSETKHKTPTGLSGLHSQGLKESVYVQCLSVRVSGCVCVSGAGHWP